jgi:D-alanine transaminase
VPLPICFLNGEYQPLEQARISPLDRAFLFGDAVYEVVPVYGGRPFRLREHLDRLNRSLTQIRMAPPLTHGQWLAICVELVGRNGDGNQYLYIQVSRGAPPDRNHAWPEGLAPTLFACASALDPVGRGAISNQLRCSPTYC